MLRLLEAVRGGKECSGYCYEKRKEEIRYRETLKMCLLRKYSLLDFGREGRKTAEVWKEGSNGEEKKVTEKGSRKINK